ncbi:MAG: hypothetical protein MUF64_00030 [Polyangiaceae bacterium]|jgi:hypothetical protein|nr:hypothetical protein [Polyangiaceae bacterium]
MSDREQILRRRAAFLSSALVALAGCERQGGGPGGQAPVVEVPPSSAPLPARSGAPSQAQRPALPPLDVEAPSLDPPAEVGPHEADAARLVPELISIRARLDASEQQFLLACAADCGPRLQGLAEALEQLDDSIRGLSSLCPASSPEGKALERWQRSHQEYLARRLGRVDSAIQEAIRRQEGPAGELRWRELRAEKPRPMICLSCIQW